MNVTVSVPHRLDIGGTWDLPPLLYFGRQYQPKTLTIALDVLTTVSISESSGRNDILVSQLNQDPLEWSGTFEEYDYTSRLGLIQAVLAFCDMKDVRVDIDIGVPPQVGLGGSGALCVALVMACAKHYYNGNLETKRIVRIAHDIENGFFSMTGFQDQMAALTGGVRLWHWQYLPETSESEELLAPEEYSELEDRIVIAIVGKHDSTEINQQQVQAFLTPETRNGWVEMNKGTALAAKAIKDRDWDQLTTCIRSEHKFRNRIAPQRIAGMEEYIKGTENGAFATAGAGQAVCWYFGEDKDDVQKHWEALGGTIIPSKIKAAPMVTGG